MCFFLFNDDLASLLGNISTVISIILAISSFIYSFISGEQTLKLLDEIRAQNSSLVDRINFELSKDNYDKKNIENIDKMIDNK